MADKNSSIKFKTLPISQLIPYAMNSRTHSDEQVAQIAASIQEFGFTSPVLVGEDNVLIAGHGRLLAARKLRLKDVPAMVIAGLTETQRRALVLADNRLALSAGWDHEMLATEIRALADADYDIALTGLTEDEITKFLAEGNEGQCDPDEEAPEPPAAPIAKMGDTWILGKHRLRCGDSTNATDVEALLQGVKPHLMVTDPPYGVNYDASWREDHDLNIGKKIGGKYSGRSTSKVNNDDKADWTAAWALFPGNIAYVWHGALHAQVVAQNLIDCGFKIRSQIIWTKQHFVFGRGDYHWQHEPCWYAVKEGKGGGNWQGDRKQTTVWEINNNNPFGTGGKAEEKTGHSTQKPVECMKRPIENNSSPGQAIYEPFSGSGTTLIAAEMTGRICYAIEINPAYVDVAVQRWEKFTGQKAVLEGAAGSIAAGKAKGRKTKGNRD